MANLGHLGYLLADHRMITFSRNCCTAFARTGATLGNRGAAGGARQAHQTSHPRVPCGHLGWRSGKLLARLPENLQRLAASHCPWAGVKAVKPGSRSSLIESSPFLVTTCCTASSAFLLSRGSAGRSFAVASHLHSSAFRLWRILHRTRSGAPLLVVTKK